MSRTAVPPVYLTLPLTSYLAVYRSVVFDEICSCGVAQLHQWIDSGGMSFSSHCIKAEWLAEVSETLDHETKSRCIEKHVITSAYRLLVLLTLEITLLIYLLARGTLQKRDNRFFLNSKPLFYTNNP